jgi:hypothetical protein
MMEFVLLDILTINIVLGEKKTDKFIATSWAIRIGMAKGPVGVYSR